MAKPLPTEEIEPQTVRTPRTLAGKLKELAKRDGVSVSAYCVAVLEDAATQETRVIQPAPRVAPKK